MAEITFLPIPNGDRIQYCIDVILKEAKLEDRIVKQLFYTMLSMYTNDPRNTGVNSPTGEGKNYVIRKVADLFPKEDVIKLVGMSDKSLFHRPGKLVIKNESGEYEFIEETIERIESDIEDKESEALTTTNKDLKRALKAQIRGLQKEKKDVYRDAKKLIDLSHKTIIFLDTPRPELFNWIMSVLSHDEYEVEYDFVDTNNGIKTRTNVLRGWPVFIFAQAVDFSHHKRWPEIQRRFTITNPRMDQEKYNAAIDLIYQKYCLPHILYQKLVVTDQQKDQAREIVKALKEKILDVSNSVEPGKNNVFIPFEKVVKEATASAITKTRKASDMTFADRICGYLTLLAQVNVDRRPVISIRKKGEPIAQKIPLATFDDLKEAFYLMQYSNGVRPYILDWYNDVFLPTYDAKSEPDSKTRGKDHYLIENRIAVTTEELSKATFKLKQKKFSSRKIRETYLFPLINEGYVDTQPSQLDGRAEIYFPVIGTEKTDTKIGEKEILGQSPIFDPQMDIRSSMLALLEIEREDTIVQTKSIEELMEYYKEPKKYFKIKHEITSDSDGSNNNDNKQDKEKNIFSEGDLRSISNGTQNESDLSVEAQKKEIDQKSPNLLSGTESLNNNLFQSPDCAETDNELTDQKSTVNNHPGKLGYPSYQYPTTSLHLGHQ